MSNKNKHHDGPGIDEPVTTIGEMAADTMTNDTTEALLPFGPPTFTIPDRQPTSADGKARLLANVMVPINGLGLGIMAGVWLRESEKDGFRELTYSVGLPRQLRPIEGDPNGVDSNNLFRSMVIDAFDKWSADPFIAQKLEAPKVTPKVSGRLVRRVPVKVDASPDTSHSTVNAAAVQS